MQCYEATPGHGMQCCAGAGGGGGQSLETPPWVGGGGGFIVRSPSHRWPPQHSSAALHTCKVERGKGRGCGRE